MTTNANATRTIRVPHRITPVLLGLAIVALGCRRQDKAPPQPPVVEATPAASIGVSVLDSDGNTTSIDALRAETTVIVLWASYCPTCKRELPAVHRLAELYRDDPDVAIIVLSTDSQEQHARARAMLAATTPQLESFYVARERDMYPLAPRRPDGTPVLSLPMTLVIDANDTWHYTYGGGTTEDGFVAKHRTLIEESRNGTLVAATKPPPRSVMIQIENEGERFRFTILRAPEDETEIIKQLFATMHDVYGYSQESLDAIRPVIEQGLQRDEVEFVFDRPQHPSSPQP